MKQQLLFFIIFSAFIGQSQVDKGIKDVNVLFIGNSLTFYHDMPQMVQEMLNETHPHIKIHQITFPGMFLSWHLDKTIMSRDEESISVRAKTENETTESELKLSERPWDIIILQEGTIRVIIPESRNLVVDASIKKIKAFVNNPNCRYILFNTWASKLDYPKKYCYPGVIIDKSLEQDKRYCAEEINNLDEHTALINDAYQYLASNNAIEKSNNANLFLKIRKDHPEIDLFDDTFHPSVYGSFLNACEFYQILSGKKASSTQYVGTIEENVANTLKIAALINYME